MVAIVSLTQVLRSVRTGISYQGKPVIAMCLEDIASTLKIELDRVRHSIKESGIGKHNISKDFLPVESVNMTIKRGQNCRSRKCTVVWLENLPQVIQTSIGQGMLEWLSDIYMCTGMPIIAWGVSKPHTLG